MTTKLGFQVYLVRIAKPIIQSNLSKFIVPNNAQVYRRLYINRA